MKSNWKYLLFGMILDLGFNLAKASECVSRSEFESLKQLTQSHIEDMSAPKQAHFEDVSNLKREMQQLKEANAILEKKVAILERQLENIQQADVIEDVVNDVEIGYAKNKGYVDPVPSSILDGNVVTYVNDDDNLPNETSGVKVIAEDKKSSELKRGVHQRYLMNEFPVMPVAFSVFLNESGAYGLGRFQILKYHKVLTNVGNGYDVPHGVFTAPVSGVYAFSLTLMSRPGESQTLWVMKNGVKMFHVHATGPTFNRGSKTIVFEVKKGDEVWVQTTGYSWASSTVHGDDHTSFTGFLLYASDE